MMAQEHPSKKQRVEQKESKTNKQHVFDDIVTLVKVFEVMQEDAEISLKFCSDGLVVTAALRSHSVCLKATIKAKEATARGSFTFKTKPFVSILKRCKELSCDSVVFTIHDASGELYVRGLSINGDVVIDLKAKVLEDKDILFPTDVPMEQYTIVFFSGPHFAKHIGGDADNYTLETTETGFRVLSENDVSSAKTFICKSNATDVMAGGWKSSFAKSMLAILRKMCELQPVIQIGTCEDLPLFACVKSDDLFSIESYFAPSVEEDET